MGEDWPYLGMKSSNWEIFMKGPGALIKVGELGVAEEGRGNFIAWEFCQCVRSLKY